MRGASSIAFVFVTLSSCALVLAVPHFHVLDIIVPGPTTDCGGTACVNVKPCSPACPTGCTAVACVNGFCQAANCPGSTGDPEMKGMDGRKFFFDGEAGKVFNLISQEHHQVNALFVEGPHRMAVLGDAAAHNGTYIGAMGMKLYDTTVEISVDEDGQLSALYNNAQVVATAEHQYVETFNADHVNVTYEEYRPSFGQTVEVRTPLYRLVVYSTKKQWNADEQQVTRGHLNMIMIANTDKYMTSDVHGVLGQISPNTAAEKSIMLPELQTAFLGEGADADYIVSSLFADDFKYNRFGEAPSALYAGTVDSIGEVKLTAARRSLSGVSQNIPKLAEWVAVAEI